MVNFHYNRPAAVLEQIFVAGMLLHYITLQHDFTVIFHGLGFLNRNHIRAGADETTLPLSKGRSAHCQEHKQKDRISKNCMDHIEYLHIFRGYMNTNAALKHFNFEKIVNALVTRSAIRPAGADGQFRRTEELYKKDLHDPDNHDGVITHLEPDILECEVKWALGNITINKASGDDGISVELFQILKDDAVKVLHSICQQIWKTQLWPQDWKRSVFIPIPKKGNAKECSNYCTIALISYASEVMLKILQARFQ